MPTIQDIAKHASVSKATVSRVINKADSVTSQTREKVEEAMRQLNFHPNMMARSLAGGCSMTIGILTQNIGSPFYDAVAQGVIEGLADTGYSPIFVDGRWQQSEAIEVVNTLLGRNVDGLVLVGGDLPVSELDKLAERLPTVIVGRDIEHLGDRCIFVDNVKAGFDATNHLIESGHRDIALIHGLRDQPDAVDRYEGYRQAMEAAGYPVRDSLVYYGDFSGRSGVLGVNSFLEQSTHFTAIVAANDMVAFGARLALHRKGIRVPDDVSIIGFDDQAEAAFMTPPLTTMRQPAVEMGNAAAAVLVGLLKSEEVNVPELSITLQVRESVARLRRQ